MATEESSFPMFADGDVLIVNSRNRTYHLHAGVLRRSSTTFAELLDESNAAVLSPKAKKEGIMTRFRLDLTEVTGTSPGTFVRRVGHTMNGPPASQGLEREESMLIKACLRTGRGLPWS